MKKDDTRNGNDGDAQNQADPIPANRFLKKSRHRAQPLDHHSSGFSAGNIAFNAARPEKRTFARPLAELTPLGE
jgi:hypothetical protein